MTNLNTDVLVVGAGPVGLVTALLLEKVGLRCLVVERRPTLHTAPQAHVISSRSLEICRSAGVSDGPIRAAGPNPADTMNIRWVDHMAGRDLGVFSMAADPQALRAMLSKTPTPTTNLSQDLFEHLLHGHMGNPENVLFQREWQSFEPANEGCVSTLTDASGASHTVTSRYLVGADGAGSRVRKAIGASMVGPDNIQTFINIHFNADLRELVRGREALLYWVMDAACTGTFIAHDIDRNWIFMKTMDPGDDGQPIDEDKYRAALMRAIGADVNVTINSMNTWRMTAQISDTYQSGNVFLAGDAAHRFPPTGGIGMNTGLQDAHNLVWKIAMVQRGLQPALLDTYQTERKPVAETNSTQSLTNALKMSEVAKLLDVNGDGFITMSDLDTVMSDPRQQAAVQEAVDRQAPHFNMSGLDLGFCYTSDAVLSDGPPPQSDNPVSEYLPSTTPGTRMPHTWLTTEDGRVSTLDLIDYGRFAVLTTATGDTSTRTKDTVVRLQQDGYPIDFVDLGQVDPGAVADNAFAQLFDHPVSPVLVVRPDGHIAARISEPNASEALQGVMARLFPLA